MAPMLTNITIGQFVEFDLERPDFGYIVAIGPLAVLVRTGDGAEHTVSLDNLYDSTRYSYPAAA